MNGNYFVYICINSLGNQDNLISFFDCLFYKLKGMKLRNICYEIFNWYNDCFWVLECFLIRKYLVLLYMNELFIYVWKYMISIDSFLFDY